MRLLATVAAVVCLGCLPRIPPSGLAPALDAPKTTVHLCRLTGETSDRFLLSGIDTFSFAPWQQCIGSVVVQRADGLLVIDPVFSREVGRDMAGAPLLAKLAFGGAQHKKPLLTQLDAAKLDPLQVKWVALTHAHWDHTGGIPDLPRAQVMLSRAEFKAFRNLHGAFDRGAIPRHLAIPDGRWAPFEYDGPAVLGFESSHDLFGDGAVLAVPLPGHTPGSAGYVVRGDDGKTWLFAGDSAWALEGVARPAHKNPIVAALLDGDTVQTAQTLARLHAVYVQRPEVRVVPAHDLGAFSQLPECASPPGAR